MNNPGPNQQLVVAVPQNKYPCRVAPCMDSFRQTFKRDCHEAAVHSQGDCFLCQCCLTAQGNSRFISHLNGAQRHQREVARSVETMKQNGILLVTELSIILKQYVKTLLEKKEKAQ